jgi:hypothetical protein
LLAKEILVLRPNWRCRLLHPSHNGMSCRHAYPAQFVSVNRSVHQRLADRQFDIELAPI